MKLLGREISHRTSLILGVLVVFVVTAAGFGVYGLVSDESTESSQTVRQIANPQATSDSQESTESSQTTSQTTRVQATSVPRDSKAPSNTEGPKIADAEPTQLSLSVPKPEGPALSSEDIPETVSLPDSQVIDIALGASHSCALHQDTTVSCWGSNRVGQIGAGEENGGLDSRGRSDPVTFVTPTKVKLLDDNNNLVDLSQVKSISSTLFQTCALHQDTTVSCWGVTSHPQPAEVEKCLVTNSSLRNPEISRVGNCASKVKTEQNIELSGVLQIAAGGVGTCVLMTDRTVSCWDNNRGPTYPKKVPTLENIETISAGNRHICVLHSDTTVSCWGQGSYGRLGDLVPDVFDEDSGVEGFQFAESRIVEIPRKVQTLNTDKTPMDLTGVKAISAGVLHSCALHIDETISCWGDLYTGPPIGDDYIPNIQLNPKGAVKFKIRDEQGNPIEQIGSLTSGYGNNCVTAKQDKRPYCWGDNDYGQIGHNKGGSYYGVNPQNSNLYPTMHKDGYVLVGISKIDTSYAHTCVIHGTNNAVSCWGEDEDDQLGLSFVSSTNNTNILSPSVDNELRRFEDVKSVSAGVGFTCGIHGTDNTVSCFGLGKPRQPNQVGNDDISQAKVPQVVLSTENTILTGATAISSGDKYVCVIYGPKDTVSCWGTNNTSLLDSFLLGAADIGIENAVSLSVGYNHTCVVDISGKASCWGDNTYGQLGGSDLASSDTPVEVTDSKGSVISDFTEVSTGYAHSCAIHRDKTISCWGLDDTRLGHNNAKTFEAVNTPTLVYGVQSAVSLSAGHSHTCSIVGVNGNVKCWGFNDLSQLGNPNVSGGQSTAVEVVDKDGEPLSVVQQISSGETHSCVLVFTEKSPSRPDRYPINCWGFGSYIGRLTGNDNLKIPYAAALRDPDSVHLPRFIGVTQITNGKNHICNLDAWQSISCWGSNYQGELGIKRVIRYYDSYVSITAPASYVSFG